MIFGLSLSIEEDRSFLRKAFNTLRCTQGVMQINFKGGRYMGKRFDI
jgi:hypothetical protein